MATVRLENVQKVYEGGVVAVHAFSLEIADKEFVVLVGPSGCGKSTTLRMIAGLEEVSEGTIYIDGRPVNDVSPKDRDIAMVFQNYALYPHMSVYENMAFGLKLRRLPRADVEKRVREAAGILAIENLLDRKPKALSGGQRQRVAVGRAIVRKPKVFLFDEPLSNLDAKLRVQMRAEISRLHKQLGATMIYVTHDQTEAMTMADRIVLMKDGHVQQIDTPIEIYRKPTNRFVAGFIGSPSMNFFDGSLAQANGLRFQETGGGINVPAPSKLRKRLSPFVGKPLTLGLRPEHIGIRKGGVGSYRTKAKVEIIEPMGNEVYVHFSTRKGGPNYIARLSPDDISSGVKTIDLSLEMDQAHFFDGQSQMVI